VIIKCSTVKADRTAKHTARFVTAQEEVTMQMRVWKSEGSRKVLGRAVLAAAGAVALIVAVSVDRAQAHKRHHHHGHGHHHDDRHNEPERPKYKFDPAYKLYTPPPVVRDHRGRGTDTSAPGGVKVTPTPTVRDHRKGDNATGKPGSFCKHWYSC
jgi:hypothetical protein